MKRAIQSNIDRSSGILKQDNQALEDLSSVTRATITWSNILKM